MRRASGSRVRALTVGWDGGGEADESFEAERLARVMGAECERLTMTEADFWSLAPRIAAAIDDPTADAAVLPSWMLGRAAAAGGLKVTLCGEGADELFGGYSRYRKRRAPWRWLTRKPRTRGTFGGAIADGWRDGIAAAEATAGAGRSALQAAQAVDCAEWLPNDLLTKLDRTLMVHGVEGRTPFLDPVVADFAFRLPDAQKAGARFGKRAAARLAGRRVSGGRRLRAQEGVQAAGGRLDGAPRGRARGAWSRTTRRWPACCPRRESARPSPRPSARRSRPGRCCSRPFGTAHTCWPSRPRAISARCCAPRRAPSRVAAGAQNPPPPPGVALPLELGGTAHA